MYDDVTQRIPLSLVSRISLVYITHIDMCVRVCVCVCVRAPVYVCVCVCVFARARALVRTYVHTHTHTHTHTHAANGSVVERFNPTNPANPPVQGGDGIVRPNLPNKFASVGHKVWVYGRPTRK